eukprot:jgi/Ulvmu1/5290/UM022_0084.1
MFPSCPRTLRVQRVVYSPPSRTRQPLSTSRLNFSAKIPSTTDDKDAAGDAFHKAYEAAMPECTKIKGLQAFAGAVWDRRRHVPSQVYNDPLLHLFEEFDKDSDGHLTHLEIADALQSNRVDITPEQVQMFIDLVDKNNNQTIERDEFPELIWKMATADLNANHHAPAPST